jgi:hypothetical protein
MGDCHGIVRMRALARPALAAWLLVLAGCATWQPPPPTDDAALRARAVTETVDGIRLSAAVLSAEDSRRWFGLDVNATGVQPVWIELANDGGDPLWLLRAGTDPDYFSPHEVAWSFHAPLGGSANAAIDAHFESLDFENPIPPGATRSGIIFTNAHRRTRVLNVDLLGPRRLVPFTLFVPVPDDEPDVEAARILALYEKAREQDLQELDALRAALAALPCCAAGPVGDPVNLVLVSELDDVGAALQRRGFRADRRAVDDAQVLFGRPPDIVARKAGSAGLSPHWMRVWVAPLTFRGQSVFVGQVGRPVGGRTAAAGDRTRLHPNVDEARNMLIQDLLYSGGLARLGFVAGGPTSDGDGDARYSSDGLRAVLFFVTRPLALSDIEFLDWEPYLEQHNAEAAARAANTR